MARVNNNVVVDGLLGTLGNQIVFKRDKAGRTIVSKKPEFGPDRVFSEAQKAQQGRFREAMAYAKEVARREPVYAELAEGTPRTAYNVAVSDWFNPPVVEEVDASGYTGQAGEVIRARVAQERSQPAEALEHFDETFRLWPDNPWARYHSALAAETLGDFDRASDDYRYAIRISPGATDARVRLARIHQAEGRPRDALHMLLIRADAGMPLDDEGQLLAMELWARAGMDEQLRIGLAKVKASRPEDLGRVAARASEGLRDLTQRQVRHAAGVVRDTDHLCHSSSRPQGLKTTQSASLGRWIKTSQASGASSNLIERAADVSLKERRPLVIVPREAPLNRIQIENLLRATRAGATVVPAMPAFYNKPQTFEDLADFIVGRVLSLLKIPHSLFTPWSSDTQSL